MRREIRGRALRTPSSQMERVLRCNCWLTSLWLVADIADGWDENAAFSIGLIFGAAVVLAGLAYFLGRNLGKRRPGPASVVPPPPPTITAPALTADVQASSLITTAPLSSSQSPSIPVSQSVVDSDAARNQETATTKALSGKRRSGLSTLCSEAALEQWWVMIPARLRRYSATLSTAWVDGMYLTAWPRWAMLLSLISLAFGFLTGATHWSFLTIDATGSASPPAIVFAQMLPLVIIAVAVGSLSANAGTMLVLGYALGDYLFAGPQLQMNGSASLPLFFYLRVPQLISYIFFFMLAVVPILVTKTLLAGLNRRLNGGDIASVIVRTAAAAVVQAALVYGWTLGAVMVIRISWAWAGHSPPLSERHYLQATNPWLPMLAAVAVAVRGWVAFRARNDKSLKIRARELALALSASERQRAITRRLPPWLRTVFTATVMTLLTAGYINSIFLGAVVFLVYAVILFVAGYWLPGFRGWAKWTRKVGKVPLLVRLALVILAGYLITTLVLALPGQSTQLNGVPGAFLPEIASVALGLIVAGALLPRPLAATSSKRSSGTGGKTLTAHAGYSNVKLIVLAILVLISSKAYADICLDPVCCFGTNLFALLAAAALLLLLAILLLWYFGLLGAVIEALLTLAALPQLIAAEILDTLSTWILGEALFPASALPAGELISFGERDAVETVVLDEVPELEAPEEILRQQQLGLDPRTGQFREAELRVAQQLEERVGQLTREPTGAYDWVDADGGTYDAVGPAPPQHFNAEQFNEAIEHHLLKEGLDHVVVDISNLDVAQQRPVRALIDGLDAAQRERIILLE